MGLSRREETQLGVLKTKQENSDTFGPLTPKEQKTLEELQQKQGNQSSLFDNLGIFSTLQASEIDPDNPPSMLPTGAMDRETPFGDRLQPEVPSGGGIFSGRQFDQIRGGPESGAFGVRGISQVQDLPINLEELAALEDDIIEQQLAAASRGEGETFFDRTRDIGGSVLDYIKGGGMIGRGITSLTNMLGDAFRGSRFYNPITESGNRLFKPFSRPGNPSGMGRRRAADRISYMLNRGAAGKGFSQTNLDNIMRGFGLQDVDTGSMMDSIAESAKTGYGGYGSSDAAAAAAASGGRDYSSSPGAMAGDMEYGEE